jgi:hypothetical protein
VLDAVYQSIEEGLSGHWCFRPHHVVRAVRGEKSVELALCFQCTNVGIWQDGEKRSDLIPISLAAEPVLNELLKKAGVPLDSEAK